MENEQMEKETRRKKIVVPGELVTEERKRIGSHVFVDEGKVYADSLGISYPDSSTASVVPLHGKYIPGRNDLIVGIISNETFNSYIVDINSIYHSFISKDSVRHELKRGSIISAIIQNVDEINEADLEDIRVFFGGEVIEVSPVKVPRIIGKNGSMLNVLKDNTGCNLIVGRNGWVWAKDGNLGLLVKAIRLIERESHLSDLTNKVEAFLKDEKGETKK
ncbi:MAG: hypothetical protein JW744_04590 [Candidatus Diapherotrites archaeon]|uniref:Exosome complex component Rrp4 n=1 Tax=Candidatus Iainarchaeum sp. TaxID=3101447 RepID=A0A938YP46_9ARCH|nr:hypothetical protein [Candidatus Diapherotrites archaeon]